ncbi:unnamed protein product [Adineta steineri]|uniref:ChrR-like cupin domain-containing protein n=1 Tax=Adineta steineri TaxID=433720 RepID=A0A814UK80_9BILA|nr:unnamed protein product [Adineta steineri]CAF1229387.1 unnamed protein product [Adineta steineri]CAF3577613.1 unnamed protein product [Adineta steineri]CAF4009822.1 unnamed protein product [Adineta steineri]
MELRSDLSVPHVIDSNLIPFVDSPTQGVQRRMLDRIGDEVARATTIVKYSPFARFPRHTHGGGEEFVILDGVFSDDLSGDHGPMSYCRHGIGTTHEPWTGEQGAILLVKLRQMNDRTETPITIIDTEASTNWKKDLNSKRQRIDLFSNTNTGENVWMEKWEADFEDNNWIVGQGGEEIFVLRGDLSFTNIDGTDDENNKNNCTQGFWIRRPIEWAGRQFKVKSQNGCQLFIKTGHLAMKLDEIR